MVEFNSGVVQDDIDRPQAYLLLTPALTRVLLAAHTSGGISWYGLRLRHGARDQAAVERETSGRRDLAVLKTIGFTQRQLAATVTWQATIAAIIGIAAGGPLGIILGRWLWTLFARQIYAVPEPTVPAASVALLALGTLLLVNLVAALPGRAAARTPAALAQRGMTPHLSTRTEPDPHPAAQSLIATAHSLRHRGHNNLFGAVNLTALSHFRW